MFIDTSKLSLDSPLTHGEYLAVMFDRTDSDGILYIPDIVYSPPAYFEKEKSYKCKMSWSYTSYEKFCKEYQALYEDIQKIALQLDNIKDEETARTVLNGRLFSVWKKYLKDFTTDFDEKIIDEIEEKFESIEIAKALSRSFAEGKALTDGEKAMLKSHIDITITDEDYRIYEEYCDAIDKDASARIGAGRCAALIISRARRLCKLLSIEAPEVISNNESSLLAGAMALHSFCTDITVADNNVRIAIERIEAMSDEELDALSKPKKTNSRKSLAPLFVYFILKSHSNSKKHLKHKDILEKLSEPPYEVFIERKALSRIIHNLEDSGLYIFSDPKLGTWCEQEAEE